jgi:outer membrane protein assembly factor BamB
MMKHTLMVLMVLAAAAFAHPWACFHGDPQHSGRAANAVGAPLTQFASQALGGDVSGSPVVRDDGNVLVGARDVKLYCFNALLSANVWTADLAAYGTSIYFSAPALDAEGNAYITTNRKLVKVSAGGAVLWAWPSHNSLSISHSPTIGADGKVYFACYSDSLYALNPDSTLAWARDLGGDVNSSPAVGRDGRVYIATGRATTNYLRAFNPDGSEAWTLELADDGDFASPAVGPDSTVYLGAGRYLYAVSPAGTVKWRDSLSAVINSCPAVANESTLYVTAGTRLYNVSTDSGVRWRKSLGGTNYCSPAVDANGYVYVGSANGTGSMFYCLAEDSTVLSSEPVGDDVWSSPAIGATGNVYVGVMNGSLLLFRGPGAVVAEAGTAKPVRRFGPNPTTGLVRFSGAAGSDLRCRVFDAAGREVAARRTANGLDLRGLEPGVYLVEFGSAAGRVTEKLILR